MSTKSNEINDKNPLSTYIKLENDTDDDLIYENSLELNHQKDYYSTPTSLNPSITSAYKGKIEVTSKGRRKIFDGVRWQILCRRPGLIIIYPVGLHIHVFKNVENKRIKNLFVSLITKKNMNQIIVGQTVFHHFNYLPINNEIHLIIQKLELKLMIKIIR